VPEGGRYDTAGSHVHALHVVTLPAQ